MLWQPLIVDNNFQQDIAKKLPLSTGLEMLAVQCLLCYINTWLREFRRICEYIKLTQFNLQFIGMRGCNPYLLYLKWPARLNSLIKMVEIMNERLSPSKFVGSCLGGSIVDSLN